MKRISKAAVPYYETKDGKWYVWKEPYYPYRWYANQTDDNCTEVTEGFETKKEAVAYLAEILNTDPRKL